MMALCTGHSGAGTPLPSHAPLTPAPWSPPMNNDGVFPGFVCSTCGRTDLPETGDWDPPICQECDAAINFDAITMETDDFD